MEIRNKKAFYNYEIIDKYTAGIKLKGEEVKSLRGGKGNLIGSYVSDQEGELYLVGFNITKYSKSSNPNYNPKRKRKLLLKKSEIANIRAQLNAKGRTVVPLRVFLKDNLFKVEIAIAKGRKKGEKKQYLKEKQIDKDIQRELRNIR